MIDALRLRQRSGMQVYNGDDEMAGIPSKCPKCGRTKAWKEEVNAFKSGIPLGGGLFRIRLGMGPGLLSGPIRRALGC